MCGEAARLLKNALTHETDDNIYYWLAQSLAAVAVRLEPSVAAQLLSELLTEEKVASMRGKLAADLATVAARLEPTEAARVCSNAARLLKDALTHEEVNEREQLAKGLAAVAGRLEPAEAIRLLNEALTQEMSAWARVPLAVALVTVAKRLEPAEAARVCVQATQLLKDALAHERLVNDFGPELAAGALGLVALAKRLDPPEAVRLSGLAARLLNRALASEDLGDVRPIVTEGLEPAEALLLLAQASAEQELVYTLLAEDLAAVAARLDRAEAADVCTKAARLLSDALTREKNHGFFRGMLAQELAAVAGRLEPAEAARLCAKLPGS